MSKEKAITPSGFAGLSSVNMANMAAELNGLDTGFERVKIPSSGSVVFEVPNMETGGVETVNEFSAVILYHHPLHVYYKDKYTGGNNAPDCASYDGVMGAGEPGGECENCEYNRFGTGENGAKACKNRRRIYLLREGEIFPLLLSLPTGSLGEFAKYIKRLLTKRPASNCVVTHFTLQKTTNRGGLAYSQAVFSVERDLNETEQAAINALTEQVKAYSLKVAAGGENDV